MRIIKKEPRNHLEWSELWVAYNELLKEFKEYFLCTRPMLEKPKEEDFDTQADWLDELAKWKKRINRN